MLINFELRHTALIALLCVCLPTTSMAAPLNGEALILTDLSPYIAFVDTSTADGTDWIVAGAQDHFYIYADQGGMGGTNFLDFDSVSSSIALGLVAGASGDVSIALGHTSSAGGNFATALGAQAVASGNNSISLGRSATSSAGSSSALGNSAFATGTSSIAIGTLAQSSGISSVAIGHATNVAGPYAVALGYGAKADGDSSTAIGTSAYASQASTIVLGSIPGVNSGNAYANIGMGTSAPIEAVDVERSAAAARFQLTSFTSTPNEAAQFVQRRARGTSAAPTAVLNGDNLGLFSFRGWNGSAYTGTKAGITVQAAGNWTPTSNPTRILFGTTPVGSTTFSTVMEITPDKKIRINGANLNVPDYVFEDDYELMPLDELKTFIDVNGHLPGIASAAQVKDEGLDLAGSQMSQLQKIEELTLYTLQLAERVEFLEAKLAQAMSD